MLDRITQVWKRLCIRQAALRAKTSVDDEDVSTALSLVIGVALLGWLIVSAVTALGTESREWWHARVAQDLVTVQARVCAHTVEEFTSDGSWGHKNNPSSNRRTTYHAYPVLEMEYRDASGAAIHGKGTFSEIFDRRAAAVAFMAKRYPVGAELAMLKVPGQDGRLLFTPDQAPSLWGLVVRVVTELLLLVFIYLPLVVMAAFAIPAVLRWLIAWPLRRWRP